MRVQLLVPKKQFHKRIFKKRLKLTFSMTDARELSEEQLRAKGLASKKDSKKERDHIQKLSKKLSSVSNKIV